MTSWKEIANSSMEDIFAWAGEQSWAQAMAACGQDAQWHAEGDVWTHTKMVCRELEQLQEWPDLSKQEQLILIFTALLHDAGKPDTTVFNPKTGRTESPKHSLKSEAITRVVLRNLGCEIQLREEIARLVRYHGRPPFLLYKKDPNREVISLSWYVNHKLLYLFALADTRGRISQEMTRPEENLHLWKEVAVENDCYETAYSFVNEHARFLFYRDELSSLHYSPHVSYRCTVTMMSGLPGSGKDTWLLNQRPKLPVVSLDAVRNHLDISATSNQGKVVQAAREQCREFLRQKKSFAFNATNLLQRTRKTWIDLFHSYDARVEIIYVEPPLPVLLQQNRNRQQQVPEKVINNLVEKLEPPLPTEGHQVQFV